MSSSNFKLSKAYPQIKGMLTENTQADVGWQKNTLKPKQNPQAFELPTETIGQSHSAPKSALLLVKGHGREMQADSGPDDASKYSQQLWVSLLPKTV